MTAIRKMVVTLRNRPGIAVVNRLQMRPHHQSALPLDVLVAIRNRARHRKYRQTHPDHDACGDAPISCRRKAGHRDEECHAHQKRRRKHGQVLHRAHLPSARAIFACLRPSGPAQQGLVAHGGRRGAPRPAHLPVLLHFPFAAFSPIAPTGRPPLPAGPAGRPDGCRNPYPPAASPPVAVPAHWAASVPPCRTRVAVSDRPAATITGERTTTVCSTPTCTSTRGSPAPAAGTAISSIWPGGRAARG